MYKKSETRIKTRNYTKKSEPKKIFKKVGAIIMAPTLCRSQNSRVQRGPTRPPPPYSRYGSDLIDLIDLIE